jgi:serine/threonine protein phosphatase PrpC
MLRHLAATMRSRGGDGGGGDGRGGGGGDGGETGGSVDEAPPTPVRGGPPSVSELAGALSAAFNSTDEAFMAGSDCSAGTTAITALVSETHVIVANAGDSRAYLWRNGRSIPLSLDHKPDRPDETARINEAGGWVSHGRVMHTLAVSRALGDRDFKRHAKSPQTLPFTSSLVTADAEVRVARLQQGDELLLACDGLWDVMTAEAAFAFLHSHSVDVEPRKAVHQLVTAADEEYHSMDNVTAVYVRLASPE